MSYDPGALEAALAAAVGDEPGLIADLRGAFFASANQHMAALRRAETADEWRTAAMKLKSLAASFGALRLMELASVAATAARPDAAALRRIERALAVLAE